MKWPKKVLFTIPLVADPPEKLSVIVPCFNEEENLRRYSVEVIQIIRPLVRELEIVLVDDGSTDQTFNRMTELGKEYSFVKVFRHPKNMGLGAAIRTGLALATGDAILFLDGDLTFHPSQVPLLLNAYHADVDCVIGSPLMGSMQGVQLFRKFMSVGVNRIYALLLGKNISAVSGIFRLYRSDILKKISLSTTSFDINSEILLKLIAQKARVVEVPVTLGRRSFGVSKINTFREIKNHLKMFVRIIKWKIGFSI